MELKDFITNSVLDVMNAIHDAQRAWAESVDKGAINPVWDNTDRLRDHVQMMEFDIAVTAESSKSGGGKAGIKVVGVEIGGSGEAKSQSSTVSRIKFAVPIVPPVQIVLGGNKEP